MRKIFIVFWTIIFRNNLPLKTVDRCTLSAMLNLTGSETGNLVVFAKVASEGGYIINYKSFFLVNNLKDGKHVTRLHNGKNLEKTSKRNKTDSTKK